MRKTYSYLLAGMTALLLLVGCQRQREHSAELFVFGTIVEVKLWGATDEQAADAFSGLQEKFWTMHREWHAWEPGLLTEINEAFAAGGPAQASEDIVTMIRHAQQIEEKSEGRFNPAIGKLIGLWGFHTSDYPVVGPPPSGADIAEVVAMSPSSLDIAIEGLTLSSSNPYVQLDFGGIAKGFAVDLAVHYLRELGLENVIVNAGGDLRAVGRHGKRPWRVAVRRPGGGVIGAIEVRGDEALFTSGNYERFRAHEQERYPHILDPRSGWPVGHVASVTVITGEGVVADASATALIVAGLDDWPEVARALELEQVLVIDEDGRVYQTPAMAQRVRFTDEVDPGSVQIVDMGGRTETAQ